MRLASSSSADQNDVALLGDEAAAGEIIDQGVVDRRAMEREVFDVLGEWKLGDGELVLDRSRLLLADLGGEQIADDALGFVLALDRGRHDLVEGGLHAVELELAHKIEDLSSFHQLVLRRLSYRAQSAIGAWRSVSAAGVMMLAGGAGSRCRARMLSTTSAEWTPGAPAPAPAASTGGNSSVSTALRMSTICRLPSSAPASLRRTRSIAAGSTQSLKGAPLRKAPGLRASTGTECEGS